MTIAGPLDWLLEPDNPSARYLTLTRLLDRPEDDPEVMAARSAILGWGPARAILNAQWPDGYWMRPGVGYSPKYKATVWQIIFLAALGAPRNKAIDGACAHALDHSRLPDGRFSAYKSARGAVVCLNGNLLRAMVQLGYDDPRLVESMEILAATIANDGFRCRFNAGSPRPARMRDGLPCAWGAIKALGAFAEVPEERRSMAVQAAVETGIAFLLQCDLAKGDYPTATSPSLLWHKFGFPLGYTSDLLEAMEVLSRLGLGQEPRLLAAVEAIREKRRADGRWLLEFAPENAWASFGKVGWPSKWVTLRAIRAQRNWE
jgi:hypothetical protein